MKNVIQKYAWGSRTAIQRLMGKPETDEPWAEVWMGAHSKASSMVDINGEWVGLDVLIRRFPHEILGPSAAERFDNALPFLFKILAADQPLSIQAHPDRRRARAGFKRENAMGLSKDDPARNYRDGHHKPECICAITPFTALKGFRDFNDIMDLLNQLTPRGLTRLMGEKRTAASEKRSFDNVKQLYVALLGLSRELKTELIAEAIRNAQKKAGNKDIFSWVIRLHHYYPDDIGILSPALMHLVTLSPGQALFLESGEPHAYLFGMGIEIMANSDNVLRGGLTVKHVDRAELLSVVRFDPVSLKILTPERLSAAESRYPVYAEEFALSTIRLTHGNSYAAPEERSVEILLCVEGIARLTHPGLSKAFMLNPGESALIPAVADPYHLAGPSFVCKASVPVFRGKTG